VTFENLGIGIARNWGFPDQLVQSMKKLPAGKIRKGASNVERLRALAGFSNELCEIILNTPDADHGKALAGLKTRFSDTVPVTSEQLSGVMEKSMQDIAQFARVVNVNLTHSDFARQASKWSGMTVPQSLPPVEANAGTSSDPAPDAMAALDQTILTSGLQDVSNSLIDDAVSINDILRMILEAMYTGMGFEHVVLCIKDGRRNAMCGKFGFGDGVQGLVRAFDFSLAGQPDVFLVALQNNADILITDIDDPKIATRVPAWYRQHVPARTFVLFPIIVKGKPVGLIYADRPHPGDITIPEKELSLLKSLRNQAVLAIRQSL